MLIDTHCHLDFKDFDPDREEVLKRARQAGVGIIINAASSLEGSIRSVELAENHDFIYAAVGIHPHESPSSDEKAFARLKSLARSKKVVAVGEVGLDYYRQTVPGVTQKEVFRKFIGLSKELSLPLIIHDRDAHADMLAILKQEFKSGKADGVMHCFSGDAAFLRQCLELGLFISFTCNLTFKNAANLRAVAREVPLDRILLETDAPFLAPQAHRGKRNEPAYITFLAQELSNIHSLTAEDIGRLTTHNANKLFRLNLMENAAIAYEIRDSLYLNITNRCTNDCDFCVRSSTDFVKGHNLKLEKEPSLEEILAAVRNPDKYKEIVFCGYGEPTLRLDVLKETACALKKKAKTIRLVTNGHGNLINKRPIAGELAGLIDKVSVSLNMDSAAKYNKRCKPGFGGRTFEEIKRFIAQCKAAGIETEATCLDLPETNLKKCRAIIENELGVKFRLRRYNVVG
ncbi:MAG: YchF/TatD family DNA exonuclease [Candidatus Omnitrophica bacterium]|nr:YchF/TatD family DNA exonuclease [Candidatus Omnitrophota bacterium]